MGMLVVPTENRLTKFSTPGIKYPALMPAAMARNIHRVR